MAKHGIHHDYDLQANAEPAAQESRCIVCGSSPMRMRWTDLHGQGVCMTCGTPYQLREYMLKEGEKPPHCTLKEAFIPIVREYHEQTGAFVFLGTSFSEQTGMKEFIEWMETHHPGWLKNQDDSKLQPAP